MTEQERTIIISEFKLWFKDVLVASHKFNTEKLKDIAEFQINPFTLYYLASFLEGNTDPISLAKVLVLPRVLQTSISTSFGIQMQRFITKTLGATGSISSGFDFDFVDQIDGRTKYCQLKSGPSALNKDDVITVDNHFKAIKGLAKANHKTLQYGDLVFCLLYGERNEINGFIRKLKDKDIEVYIGKEFWHRFTGDPNFYHHLIVAAGEISKEIDMKDFVNEVILELSTKIDQRYNDLFG